MGKNSNYQDLLKFIAIFAMILDHLGLYLFPEIIELRIVGRYAMPIFGFFVGYNFKNSINLSILMYGLVLYLLSVIFIYHYFIEANILISLFLGHLYLYFFQKHCKTAIKGVLHFIILVSLFPLVAHIIDYGSLVMGVVIIGYMVRVKSINVNIAAFVIVLVSMLHTAVTFSNFGQVEWFFSLIVAIVVWLSIAHAKFETKVPINIRAISRHSMLIYFVHILIIQFTWRYYVY